MTCNRFFGINLLLIAAFALAPLSFTGVLRAEEKKKTELNHKMEKIDEGMKKLKRNLKKSEMNEASGKVIDEIIALAKECKEMTPEKIGKMPEADRAKPKAEFEAAMTKLIETMEEMKKAVAANENEKAMTLYKSLKTQEEDGHDKFIEDDAKKEKSEK